MPAAPINHASKLAQAGDISIRSVPSAPRGGLGTSKFASVLDHAKVEDSSARLPEGLNPKTSTKETEASTKAKIEASCRQFEGIMVKQILTASKLPLVGGTGSGGAVGAIYNDLVVQTLSDQITAGGGIGLASALQTQLSRQTPAGAKSSAPSATD